MTARHIIFTVTNDLTYDQRMHRICSTLAAAGYAVTLAGRLLPESVALKTTLFVQKRLPCHFRKGVLFYAEYNLRLFFFLLTASYDAVCSIDLDTLPAGCCATLLRGKKRVFDAHEYFTEVPEVVNRRIVRACWAFLARICLPFYRHAYTVGPELAAIFTKKYRIAFAVVRNVPHKTLSSPPQQGSGLLYQGALNAGRGLEPLLVAMQSIENVSLTLAGEGDCSAALRAQATALQVNDKVQFLGYVQPEDLKKRTRDAWLGLNLLENTGLSYYYSLANKFFDSVQAGIPVLTMNFPEYSALNRQYEVAILLDDLTPASIAAAVQRLQTDQELYLRLQANCLLAREVWNWEREKETLLRVWESVF